MSSYRVDCGSMASKHEAWLGVPWGMRHPGGQFGALQAIRGHVILSEIVPKVAIVRLKLKHSSARIPLKVSVLNSLHGVGQGQMIRRGRLGNAIWREGGIGPHRRQTRRSSGREDWRGEMMSDRDTFALVGLFSSEPSLHFSSWWSSQKILRAHLSLTLLIVCFKFNYIWELWDLGWWWR